MVNKERADRHGCAFLFSGSAVFGGMMLFPAKAKHYIMSIRNTITACLLAAGLAFSICTPAPAEARTRKVVYKKKHKRHRHVVGLRHIGRGAKTKTVVKTSH